MAIEIIDSEDIKFPKITGMIYAPPGVGKTTALSHIKTRDDKPTLIVDIDNSSAVLRGIPGIKIIKVGLDMAKWMEVLDWLEAGNAENYGLINVDNLTELEVQMLTVYGRLGKNDGAPEQGHYLRSQFKIQDYVRRLRALPTDVIFTCWEDVKEIVMPDGTKYSMFVPRLSGKSVDSVCGLCNMVAHLEIGKDEVTRFFRLTSSRTAYAKDQVFKRKYCSIENLAVGGDEE